MSFGTILGHARSMGSPRAKDLGQLADNAGRRGSSSDAGSLDAHRMETASRVQERSALDDIRTLMAMLSSAMPQSDVSAWMRTPHQALKGARPVDVFFMHGLDAVLPAVPLGDPR